MEIKVKDASVENITIVEPSKRMTTDVIQLYEFSLIVSTRAAHINNGSSAVFVSTPKDTPVDLIVIQEILEKKCPFIIRRQVGHNLYEDWNVNEMIFDPKKCNISLEYQPQFVSKK